jgi:hypothetical protein
LEIANFWTFYETVIVGFSAGTFDVAVKDKFDEDMKLFISEYPVLDKAKINKTILPQWKRP